MKDEMSIMPAKENEIENEKAGSVISLRASAISSKQATQSIAPAANPRPADCHGSKCSTNMNTGTATIGCGSDEHTAHASVFSGDTPRGTSTSATANPSGTLCTAKLAEMNAPSWDPPLPTNDTPMPRPSAKECRVMTDMISNIFPASSPVMSPSFKSSKPSTHDLVTTTNPMPAAMPAPTRIACDKGLPRIMALSSSSAIPSETREKLAESIIPAAIAFDAPSQKSDGLLHMSSGTAPSPVDSAVIHP
mmetsp:Transcript_55384/g.131539  ORF Transcript_55384/g.131539 Transcript_55384/m.131539 type:complete len:249 (-) Transcript_55384:485-1231(-)